MKEGLLICLSMILGAILLGEARFGGVKSRARVASRQSVTAAPARLQKRSEDDRPPPEEPGAGRSENGKPAPLLPRPGHHLVAANALPPSEGVFLLSKD